MGALAFVGFFLSLLLLPPTKSELVLSQGNSPIHWKVLLADGYVVGLFFFRFAYIACVGIIWGFIPLYADMEFSASSASIGMLITLGVFISGLIHIPMGYLADRISKKSMVFAGGLIITYAVLAFEWAGQLRDLVLATVGFGIGGGIAMPALMAMAVLEGNKARAMGSMMALMTVAHSLGMLCGALLGGMMMDLFQLRWAFPVGALLMGLAVAFFLLKTLRQK
jgi:predicted MFS family arabinose efflux permease